MRCRIQRLELYDGNGTLLAFNDDWRTDQQAAIIATGLAPTHIRESAIVRSLSPGPYTAIVPRVQQLYGRGSGRRLSVAVSKSRLTFDATTRPVEPLPKGGE